MALINQRGIYQGEGQLNPLPYVNIALQSRARRQAKEDAIDQYYKKLPDTINDKGVRDIEVPIINDYRDKIFEFGLKHKEALRNPKLDKGAAQFNFQKLVNEAKGVARLSQDAAKDDLEVGKIRLTKGNEWLVDDEEFLAENEAHNYPVTDPRFKKIDVNKVLQGRPFDQSKIIKKYADIKMGEGTPEVTPHPTDPLLEVVKTIPVYDDKTKETIYARAVNDYHNDGSFRKEINKIKDPKEIAELNDISMKTFGHPLRPDFEEEDAAAAFMVRALAPKPTVQKVRANTGAVMDKRAGMANAEWDRRNKITYAQSLNKIRLNNQNRKEGLPTEDTGYLSDEVAVEFGKPEKVKLNGQERDVTVVYTDNVDPARLNLITGRDLSKKQLGVQPIPIKQADGSIKMGFYVDPGTGDWEGDKGQRISRERVKDDYIKSVSPTKFKTQVGTKGSENTKQKTTKPAKDPLGLF